MYSSYSTEYQNFSDTTKNPPPSAPASGIPVSTSSEFFSDTAEPRARIPAKPQVPWSTGLCDCFSDVRNCEFSVDDSLSSTAASEHHAPPVGCITCWCSCITFGQIAEIVDKGSSSCGQSGALYALLACVTCCPCCFSCFYRSKMRQQYLLHESPCGDCLVHCCCECCSLCQEYRELKNRGFDMSIGWHGNVERQNRGVVMAPVSEEGMSR